MLEFLLNVEYVDAWEKLRSLSLSLSRALAHMQLMWDMPAMISSLHSRLSQKEDV